MITIFVDEAGDLGFSQESSDNFIISLILTKNPEELRRCIRKARDAIPFSKRKPKELHWNKAAIQTRKRTLQKMNCCSFEAYILIINKKSIKPHLHQVKEKLYHYLAGLIVEEAKLDEKDVVIIFDKRSKNQTFREDLTRYILNKISEIKYNIKARVEHERSEDDKGLQAVDFICGAAFKKYEHGDSSFLDIVDEKITLEKKRFR